jgi:hypothetical protein
MHHDYEAFAKEFIESVRNVERCNWCGRVANRNRKGLCRPCDGIRKRLATAENHSEPDNVYVKHELKVARQMKKDCIIWGEMLKGIVEVPGDSLQLEGWLRRVAEKIANDKRMHYGMANTLGSTFAPAQRQVLAYLLWEVFAAEASHNRQNRASGRAWRED